MSKTKILFSFYALLSAAVIWSQLIHADAIQNILKPLLMPSLMLIYALLMDRKFKKKDYMLLAALFFSMWGDAFLMPYFDIFMAGLGSFLTAHIFYLILFIPDIKNPIKLNTQKKTIAIIGFVFYVFLVVLILSKLISTEQSLVLMLAIFIYASVLFSVFIVALLRHQLSPKSYQYILIGSALFLLSDGLLAINKFVEPMWLSRLWVMSTYTSAQAFLMYGWLKRYRN